MARGTPFGCLAPRGGPVSCDMSPAQARGSRCSDAWNEDGRIDASSPQTRLSAERSCGPAANSACWTLRAGGHSPKRRSACSRADISTCTSCRHRGASSCAPASLVRLCHGSKQVRSTTAQRWHSNPASTSVWRGIRCPRLCSPSTSSRATLTPIASDPATSNSPSGYLHSRRPIDRCGIAIGNARSGGNVMDGAGELIGQVLRALGDALVGDAVERDLQAAFEREVQRVAQVRVVRLREIPARYHARLVTPTRTSQSIVLSVPSADLRVQAVLEAAFDP